MKEPKGFSHNDIYNDMVDYHKNRNYGGSQKVYELSDEELKTIINGREKFNPPISFRYMHRMWGKWFGYKLSRYVISGRYKEYIDNKNKK